MLLLISITAVSATHGMFFRLHSATQVARPGKRMHWRLSSTTDARVQQNALDDILYAKKSESLFYTILSGYSFLGTVVGVISVYGNLHQILIRYNLRPIKQQLREDEKNINRAEKIILIGLGAQAALLFRRDVVKCIGSRCSRARTNILQ